jgi:micrococcal nuclease
MLQGALYLIPISEYNHHPMDQSLKPILYLLGILALLSLGLIFLALRDAGPIGTQESGSPPPDGERARVTYIYDGDTIEVDMRGRRWRVRYIGVDTPEMDQPYYDEATDANLDLVRNKNVILVRDVSNADQYDRLLRYVYLTDGTFVNAELLREGAGRTINIPPDVANERYFSRLEDEARRNNRGIWALEENQALPARCNTCSKNAYDCADFRNQRQAQACFDACWLQTGEDVHHLDGGGDGVVCESLP